MLEIILVPTGTWYSPSNLRGVNELVRRDKSDQSVGDGDSREDGTVRLYYKSQNFDWKKDLLKLLNFSDKVQGSYASG